MIVRQILEWLEQIHGMGIIHCDLKLENLAIRLKPDQVTEKIKEEFEFLGEQTMVPVINNCKSLANHQSYEICVADFGTSCYENITVFSRKK